MKRSKLFVRAADGLEKSLDDLIEKWTNKRKDSQTSKSAPPFDLKEQEEPLLSAIWRQRRLDKHEEVGVARSSRLSPQRGQFFSARSEFKGLTARLRPFAGRGCRCQRCESPV